MQKQCIIRKNAEKEDFYTDYHSTVVTFSSSEMTECSKEVFLTKQSPVSQLPLTILVLKRT